MPTAHKKTRRKATKRRPSTRKRAAKKSKPAERAKTNGALETAEPKRQLELIQIARRIRAANYQFGRDFVGWVRQVGGDLREAHERLVGDRDKPGGRFERWCKDECKISPSQGYRLLDAHDLIERLSPIGEEQLLPANELQCRELSIVPNRSLQKVWKAVCAHAEALDEPITAALVRRFSGQFRGDTTKEIHQSDGSYDLEEALEKAQKTVRNLVQKTPEKFRSQVVEAMRVALSKVL